MDWINDVFAIVSGLLDSIPVVRAVIGIALVFFIPGFVWSFLFFRQLSVLERFTLSIALSIVLVTLSLFAFNLLTGIRLTAASSILIILLVTILPVAGYFLNRLLRNKGIQERRGE